MERGENERRRGEERKGGKTYPTNTEVSLELRTGPVVKVAVEFPAVSYCVFGMCERAKKRKGERGKGVVHGSPPYAFSLFLSSITGVSLSTIPSFIGLGSCNGTIQSPRLPLLSRASLPPPCPRPRESLTL